jgi:hypothetical protein
MSRLNVQLLQPWLLAGIEVAPVCTTGDHEKTWGTVAVASTRVSVNAAEPRSGGSPMQEWALSRRSTSYVPEVLAVHRDVLSRASMT